MKLDKNFINKIPELTKFKAFEDFIHNSLDGFFIVDLEGHFRYANSTYCKLIGYTPEELSTIAIQDITWNGMDQFFTTVEQVAATGKARYKMTQRSKEGQYKELSASASLLKIDGEELFCILVYNYENCKEGERYAEAGKSLGKLFSQASSRKEYLDLSKELLGSWSRCHNVGIRIINEENTIPFETFTGYDENFLETENWLTLNQDQCICIRVSLQNFLEADKAIRTPKGSTFSNNFSEFLTQLPEEEQKCYRSACKLQNYASVAIIPILCRGKVMGVIHMADQQEGLFSLQTIEFLEVVATYIGVALNRFDVEDELQRHNDTLGAVAQLLNLALGNATLEEIIKHCLDTLLSIPWLSFDSRGCIYLVEEQPGWLVLKALSGEIEEGCQRIPFGYCFCGQAASQKEIQFTGNHQGSFPHGHYCVPILSDGVVLGVINIYVRKGHHRNQKEELFLNAIANTLAGIIIRKQKEMEALRSHNNKKLILESMGEGIYGVDFEGNTVFINPAATVLTGYEQGDLVGRNQHGFTHHSKPDGSLYPREECPIFLTLKHGTRQRVTEEVFWRKNGSSFPVEYVSTPVWENGQITGAVIVFKDITERKRAEEALRENEERYRSLVKQSSEGIFIFDPITRKIQEANPQFLTMLGYTEEEIKNLLIEEILILDLDLINFNIQMVIEDGQCLFGPRQYKRKDGTILEAEISGSLIRFGEAQVLMINVRDITERKQAEEALKLSFENLTRTLNETVNALAVMAEKRDPYTAGHQYRVAQLAIAIAREMNLSEERIEAIRVAGTLHDIGKIYVPTEILNKPGRLSELEMGLIKTHSQVGYEVLKSIPFACPIAEIIWQHHEKIDGTGYPLGLKEDEILLEAKILCVADVVEAIASHRPYRPALGLEKALEEIIQQSGMVYDPEVVEACLRLFNHKGYQIAY